MAGDDGGLDVAAAVEHAAQDVLQTRKRSLPGNVVGGTNFLGGDQAKGAAHGFGRVVERGLERDLGVVQAVGIDLDFGAAGTAAEEVNGASFANHGDGPLPSFGPAYGFDDDIAAALLRRERAHGFDCILNF